MDRRINKTKVKLTHIPEVYSKSYKNILKRVVHVRSLQEIGDIETLNQTQLGKLKEQGFKFEILNEGVKDSRMDLDINSGLDKLIKYSSLIKSLSENLKANKVNRKDVSELEMTINKLNTTFENFNKRVPIYLESKTDFESYLEAVNNKDKFIKLNELYLDLQRAKYKPLIDDDEKSFSVTNKRNFNITFKEKNNKIYAIVQGYKTDIDLGEVSNKFEDVKTLIDSINIKWMKENDPNGDRW